MSGGTAFTSNYSDLSTDTGYQYEFRCDRCGNGYRSTFRHSVLGFGGRLMNLGGGLLGGNIGNKMQEVGWDARWVRDWQGRGTTADKRLAEAVADVRPNFEQCHRCGSWVCKEICWNGERGLCTTCAPKLQQEVAGLQAEAQREQLRRQIHERDWTAGVDVSGERTALCPTCNSDSGGGRFCQHCGTALTTARAQRRFCGQCGTQLSGTGVFCAHCGHSVL